MPLALAAPRGIRTMPTEIFRSVQYPSDFGRAAAFGVVVMAVTVLLTLPAAPLSRQAPLRNRHRQGLSAALISCGWRGRVAALTLEILYIAGGVVLPMMAMVMVSFSGIWTGRLQPGGLDAAQFRLRRFSTTS